MSSPRCNAYGLPEGNQGPHRFGQGNAEDHFGDEARGFRQAAQGPAGRAGDDALRGAAPRHPFRLDDGLRRQGRTGRADAFRRPGGRLHGAAPGGPPRRARGRFLQLLPLRRLQRQCRAGALRRHPRLGGKRGGSDGHSRGPEGRRRCPEGRLPGVGSPPQTLRAPHLRRGGRPGGRADGRLSGRPFRPGGMHLEPFRLHRHPAGAPGGVPAARRPARCGRDRRIRQPRGPSRRLYRGAFYRGGGPSPAPEGVENQHLYPPSG